MVDSVDGKSIPTEKPRLRINLRKLLSKNVESIGAHYLKLQNQVNAAYINQILDSNKTYVKTFESKLLPYCPEISPNLVGRIEPVLNDTNSVFDDLYTTLPVIGGHWRPKLCHARHKIAIIIPYRDRSGHLDILLYNLHPVLQRQQVDYTIYVVEQYGNKTFNKARIMNIAFVTALQQDGNYNCFIFHDVDLVPEDDRNLYTCPSVPRHMSAAIDEMNYKIPYEELVGGVFAIRTEHFIKVNGYSNLYWGWGAEDDDMFYRLKHVGLPISRPPQPIARYKMIKHTKRPAVDGRIRYRLLWTGVRRYRIDGINSLPTLNYKVLHVEKRDYYTHILVDIGNPPEGF